VVTRAERRRSTLPRLSWFMPLLRPFGMAPGMNAEQQANSNIELGVISGERELGPVLTPSPSRCGMWLLRGRPSEAAVMSKNGSAPASIR
jgi:hypothetical protein